MVQDQMFFYNFTSFKTVKLGYVPKQMKKKRTIYFFKCLNEQ